MVKTALTSNRSLNHIKRYVHANPGSRCVLASPPKVIQEKLNGPFLIQCRRSALADYQLDRLTFPVLDLKAEPNLPRRQKFLFGNLALLCHLCWNDF